MKALLTLAKKLHPTVRHSTRKPESASDTPRPIAGRHTGPKSIFHLIMHNAMRGSTAQLPPDPLARPPGRDLQTRPTALCPSSLVAA